MSQQSQDELVKRLSVRLKDSRLRALHVTWFGGEPLLAMGVIRALTRRLSEIARTNKQTFDAAVVTNGYSLTKGIAKELSDHLFVNRIEVTIDGLRETHDARRPLKSGGGTYERIMRNFCDMTKTVHKDMRCVLRCNVDRTNAADIPALIQTLADLGLQSSSELYFAPVHNWGNDAGATALSPEEYASFEIEWFTLMNYLGFSVSLLPQPKPIVCMAVNPSAGLTDPYGKQFKCTELPLLPSHRTGDLYSLGLGSASLGSNAPKDLGDFIDEVARGAFDCSSCEMLPVCGGGCPKSWHDGIPPCPSAKRNLSHRLSMALAIGKLS